MQVWIAIFIAMYGHPILGWIKLIGHPILGWIKLIDNQWPIKGAIWVWLSGYGILEYTGTERGDFLMVILNSAFTANPLRTVASSPINSHDLGEVTSTVCKQDSLNFDESFDHGHFLCQRAPKDGELRAIIRRRLGPLKGPFSQNFSHSQPSLAKHRQLTPCTWSP